MEYIHKYLLYPLLAVTLTSTRIRTRFGENHQLPQDQQQDARFLVELCNKQ